MFVLKYWLLEQNMVLQMFLHNIHMIVTIYYYFCYTMNIIDR